MPYQAYPSLAANSQLITCICVIQLPLQQLYNSSIGYFERHEVHSYISFPTGPATLNLTIVVHFGHLPCVVRDFLCGFSVFLLLPPITTYNWIGRTVL